MTGAGQACEARRPVWDSGPVPDDLSLSELRGRLTDEDGCLPDGVADGSSAHDWAAVLALVRAQGWFGTLVGHVGGVY